MMNVLDLFSGIGGFSLGLEAAGMQTIAFCEIEEYPQKILSQHWPDVPIFKDVRTLQPNDIWQPVDLICGGYPCQPFSVAGQRRGQEDVRHLWPEVFRLVQGIKPRWCVFENVYGHISLGFDEVATQMESEGYTVTPLVLPACAVGAPHRRDRLWIVCHAKYDGLPSTAQHSKSRKANDWSEKVQEKTSKLARPVGLRNELVPNSNNERCKGRSKKQIYGQQNSKKKFEGSFKGWANGWDLSSPRICGMDDGIPNRTHRLKALGNAIVPQIAYWIGKIIINIEQCTNSATINKKP